MVAMSSSAVARPKGYFAWHYRILRFLGLGWWHLPDEGDTRNFFGWYLYYAIIVQIVWVLGFIVLETLDPFIGDKENDRFMICISFVITHDLTLIKICIFFFANDQIQDIVRTLEIGVYEFYQNNKRNQATVKKTKILIGSFLFFGWLTILNNDVYGTIHTIRWKAEVAKLNDTSLKPPRTLPQPIYIPWKYQTDASYAFTFVLENIGLLWTGHILITVDTFIASLILHLSTQFAILREALVTAYDRTMMRLYAGIREDEDHRTNDDDLTEESYIDLEKEIEDIVKMRCSERQIGSAIEETLKNCFRQHQVLIRCVEKLAAMYSYGFMTQLISSVTAICVVMVQVSQDASSLRSIQLLTSLAFFMAMVIQLAIQCITANELTFQASCVADAVMESKWERMSPAHRRLLMMTMIRAQRPLRLSAMGFAYLNNDCFVAIMKAAYSYYAVLSQKQTK